MSGTVIFAMTVSIWRISYFEVSLKTVTVLALWEKLERNCSKRISSRLGNISPLGHQLMAGFLV